VPWIGDTPSTIRGLARQADVLASRSLPIALRADKALDPERVRPGADRIDLSLLVDARTPLAEASASVERANAAIRDLPSVGYAPPVARARDQFLDQVDQLSTLLRRAQTAAQIAPSMLGIDGPRRYFLAFQTNAEARGTGGLAGAFAIVRADHGRIAIERVASDSELRIPPGFTALSNSGATAT
jgi:hypothetical protein